MPRKNNRKRSYRSRFNDKKINTAIEKKISDIAKAEDQKQLTYYVKKQLILADGQGWVDNISKPDATAIMTVQQDAVKHICMSQIGGYVPLISTADITLSRGAVPENPDAVFTTPQNRVFNAKYIVKTIQANLNFCNTSGQTVKVKVAIIYIPNLNGSTDGNNQHLVPSIHVLGDVNNKYKGIFRDELKANATWTNSVKSYRILASKSITLPPARRDITATIDADTPELIRTAERYYQVNLSKTYKTGLNLYFNGASVQPIPPIGQMCSNGNIYLVFAHDCSASGLTEQPSAIFCYGVSGLKFSIKKRMLPFIQNG